MLFLLFQLGRDRYALEASRVVEVVPLLVLQRPLRRRAALSACSVTGAGPCRR